MYENIEAQRHYVAQLATGRRSRVRDLWFQKSCFGFGFVSYSTLLGFSWFSGSTFVAKHPNVYLLCLVPAEWLALQKYSSLVSLFAEIDIKAVIFEIFIGSRHILKSRAEKLIAANIDEMSFLWLQKTLPEVCNGFNFLDNFFVTRCVMLIIPAWHICFPLPLHSFSFSISVLPNIN